MDVMACSRMLRDLVKGGGRKKWSPKGTWISVKEEREAPRRKKGFNLWSKREGVDVHDGLNLTELYQEGRRKKSPLDMRPVRQTRTPRLSPSGSRRLSWETKFIRDWTALKLLLRGRHISVMWFPKEIRDWDNVKYIDRVEGMGHRVLKRRQISREILENTKELCSENFDLLRPTAGRWLPWEKKS